ncbi:MAG: type IV pilus twitching motility protein PilT [Sporomusaceae bacterium]|nr:type IV pilus twitching motility protein PilT [Sporomusaceae bacterium]
MRVEAILAEAMLRQASDVHLTVGLPPMLRINGQLAATDAAPLCSTDTEKMLAALASDIQLRQFAIAGDLDFAAAFATGRCRVNVFRQQGSVALAIRIINQQPPSLAELGHPAALFGLARLTRGLVLVTGPAGSGKSTTLAALLDLINSERNCHILTLEDPIEYVHRHRRSIVHQREIYHDSQTFATALRAALREDPDVIMLGEMRDPETITTAVTAAETGHLVLASLHTGGAIQTIDRIVDSFPAYQQQQVRSQLANVLQGAVAQQLLPRADGRGRIAACEILICTPAISNLIREGKTHQIASLMQTGSRYGMRTMDNSLNELCSRGQISRETALAYAAGMLTAN